MRNDDNARLTAVAFVTGAMISQGATLHKVGTDECLFRNIYRVPGLGLVQIDVDSVEKEEPCSGS